MRSTTDVARRAKLNALEGKIGIANAQLAYQAFKRIFSDPRFVALQAKGARVQRPLWASTSTKDPRWSDILYVEALIGPQTINTLPLETINDYRDHGHPRLTIEQNVAGARQTFQNLAELGLDFDAITQQVLDDGVEKFDQALDQLLPSIETKRVAHTVARVTR